MRACVRGSREPPRRAREQRKPVRVARGREGEGFRANEQFATLFAGSSHPIASRLRFVIMKFVDDVINVD